MSTLEEVIELTKQLPQELQEEVRDLAKSLAEHQAPAHPTRMKLTWRGALSDMRDEYTSVELEHKALDWRAEAALDGCSSDAASGGR